MKLTFFRIGHLAMVVGLVGCPDTKPARIDLSQAPAAVFTKSFFQLNARVVNAAGVSVPDSVMTYSVVPTDVMRVSAAGEASCEKSGDATVTMAASGLTAVATVKCRLVSSVKSKKELRVIIGADLGDMAVLVSGADGKTMADVPLTFEGGSPMASIDQSGRVKGIEIGKGTVTISAGGASSQTELEVVEKVKSEPLAISDGSSTTYTLQTGKYLLEVQAKAGSNGVDIVWVGAPACPNQPERQEHKVYCDVANTATFTISNPSLFGMGTNAVGFMNLYKTP